MCEREIRHCEKHGDTEFAKHKNGNSYKWVCLKCDIEKVLKRREKTKLMAIAYKGGKCLCCGYNKYQGALEFHHINAEEKDFGISSKGYTRSWEIVKKELDKCVLVCSNCHKEIHAGLIPCPEEIIKDDESANTIQ